jgi:predicted 3-demethylubiquinone-9 3-methyltransferase (glyoxalase superfamily)
MDQTTTLASRASVRAGWALSILVALFLLMDGGMKLVPLQPVLDTMPTLGWPDDIGLIRALGGLTIAITALYLWPRTAPLGAVLLTGYLGGAIATHLRIGSPWPTHILFGLYVGTLAWVGLWLRDPRVRGFLAKSAGKEATMAEVRSFLWFADHAREAVEFYTSVVPNSSVDDVAVMQNDSPSGPPGSVEVIPFTLGGQAFTAMKAGPYDPFNHAFSISVECDGQAELDRIWNALLEGGKAEQCGWLVDRYGLSWQIVPKRLGELMADPDQAKAKRVGEAMMKMVKLDIGELERAAEASATADAS